MDPISPLFPRGEDEQGAQRESRLERGLQPIRVESESLDPCVSSLSRTSDVGLARHPYSPTKTELESHPIRQRLIIQSDEIPSSLGIAPEVPRGFDSCWTRPALAEEQRELAPEVGREKASTMADTTIKEGDAVSYAWGGDKKGGTVTEVATEGSVSMETARGNTATKEAKPDDPALRLERAGHDVVKNASEVQKEEAGETHNEGGVQKTVTEKNGVPNTGEKRAAEPKENGEEPKKKKGRPAKNGTAGPKKEHKKRPPKRAATESGEPRRSGRNATKSS